GGGSSSAGRVIKDIASEVGAPLIKVMDRKMTVLDLSLEKSVFQYGRIKAEIYMLGTYQPHNASIVIRAVDALKKRGLVIKDYHLIAGLKNARWKARFEKLSSDPLIISDGAHNPEGIEAAVSCIKCYFKDQKVIILTGVLKDKNYSEMAAKLSSVARRVITVKPNSPRALSPEVFASEFEKLDVDALAFDSIDEAAQKAVSLSKSESIPVICLGSLYMYADVKRAFNKTLNGVD
ncbi:MAG: hypothetical protein J5850_02705, partial [Clostridia bacterium]|nr:hypothetical protein [Clostridia bacterium]